MKHITCVFAALALVAAAEAGAPPKAETAIGSAEYYRDLAAKAKAVKPSLRAYKVNRGLSNVANLRVFRRELSAREKELIAKNMFVIVPSQYDQMFDIYENNEYQRPQKYPAFITTDSMLHTYHVFYDYSLRYVETHKLFDACCKLTEAMRAAAEKDLAAAKTPAIRSAALKNMAFFLVASALLGSGKGQTIDPPGVDEMVLADLASIKAHQGRAVAKSVGLVVDFSQFVPRGHYTRSAKLKSYFKAMMWYGNVGLCLPDPAVRIGTWPTLQALLMVRDLRTVPGALELWRTIYEPTVFYVGKADDYTVYPYGALSDKVFGNNPSVDDFGDPVKLKAFIAQVNKLPAPGIDNRSNAVLVPRGRQYRFMGQHFIPDSRVLQELTYPKVDERSMPVGLDVFAAMGSQRALQHLVRYYQATKFKRYSEQLQKMRREFATTSQATWMSNLYYGWLWSLDSLTTPAPAGYPSFMRGSAWLDKSLLTGLGSWTELRHDTILYAKQSTVECGDGEEKVPPLPKGYVEPALEVWTKLQWLNAATMRGLASRRLLDEELTDTFSKIGDWLDFCRKITIKELTGKQATRDEYEQMTVYGAELDGLQEKFAGGDIVSEADKDMAVVADVHTDAANQRVLEEGTGRVGAIYVVVPIGGKLYLTRGATYTQYEFEHPMSDRLTDEQWQKMLKQNRQPGIAKWMKSFMIQKRKTLGEGLEEYHGGC